MIINIYSGNDDFSFLIGKNPQSTPKISSIRQGFGVGFYPNGHTNNYCLVFLDKHDEVSFKTQGNESYEYLSRTQYTSAACALSLLKTFFTKLNTEKDNAFSEHYAEISFLDVSPSVRRSIESSFPAEFHDLNLSECFYTLKIKDTCTFVKFLATIESILSLILLKSNELIYVDDGMAERMINSIATAESPYFIRYLVKATLLNSKKKFEKFKDKINGPGMSLVQGWLIDSRIRFALDHIKDGNVLDLGCGEGRYARRLLSNGCSNYFGVDVNEDIVSANRKKFEKEDGVEFSTYINLENTYDHVLCSEVVEHMPLQEAEILIYKALAVKPKTILLTTPNADFNKHYPSLDDFRHNDHSWEMNKEDFGSWLLAKFGPMTQNIESFDIGDIVDGISPTQGYVLKVR